MIKKDRKKFFKAGMIFFIWIIAIFTIGHFIQTKNNEEAEKPNIKEVSSEEADPTGGDTPDSKKTDAQKEATAKVNKANKTVVDSDLGAITKAIGVADNWTLIGEATKNGVPTLKPFFPKGQSPSGWNEALVFRSFVNVKMEDPVPVVYDVFETWIKEKIPDFKIKHQEEEGGITFTGYSNSGKIFISGKVFKGSIDSVVYIAQYTVKNDGAKDTESKVERWNYILAKIK